MGNKNSNMNFQHSQSKSPRALRFKLRQEERVNVTSPQPNYDNVHGVKLTKTDGDDEQNADAELAAKIYFGENTFAFDSWTFKGWAKANPVFATLLRAVHVNAPDDGRMNDLVKAIRMCGHLSELTIGVDEAHIVYRMSLSHQGFQQFLMAPTSIDRQLNLLVLRSSGMDKLREVRIPRVTFTPVREDGGLPGSHEMSTIKVPISGGVLETVVAKDMMRREERGIKRGLAPGLDVDDGADNKRIRTAKGPRRKVGGIPQNNPPTPHPPVDKPFRFLDLPAEIRNIIYGHVLHVDGMINPSKRKPSSIFRAGVKNQEKKEKRLPVAAPRSVLTLLLTNKQVYNEAVGVFYAQNQFIFYSGNQMTSFLLSISDTRKGYIQKITLWYEPPPNSRQRALDITTMDVALQMLISLPQLKTLDLIMDEEFHSLTPHGPIKGEDVFRDLISSKGVKVGVHCLALDRFYFEGTSATSQSFHRFRTSKVVNLQKLQSRLN